MGAIATVDNTDIILQTLTNYSVVAGVNLLPNQINERCRGVTVVVDITAITGTTPTLTATIKGYDPSSGKFYTLLASAALNSTGTTVLSVYPGGPVTTNVAANACLPKEWTVNVTTTGSGISITGTISACVLV